MNRKLKSVASLTVLIAAGVIGACGQEDGAQQTQVVARVNDSEITVSQLRAALARAGAEPTPDATQKALDSLVNEQLLVDAALRENLDRDPAVVQAIANARRQILARAYIERMVLPRDGISATDQTAYYKANPALFAQRRVYQLTAFTVPSNVVDAELRAELDGTSTPEAVSAALAKRTSSVETQSLTRAAEQLPLEQVTLFAAADVGDVIVQSPQGDRTTLMLITGIQSSPITFESAQPIIEQYLTNVRNAEAVEEHLKQVRATATISSNIDVAMLGAATEASPAPSTAGSGGVLPGDGSAVLN